MHYVDIFKKVGFDIIDCKQYRDKTILEKLLLHRNYRIFDVDELSITHTRILLRKPDGKPYASLGFADVGWD